MKDKIVESVINKYQERSNVGIKKYGVTLDREDLNALDWLKHLQEELQDATLYAEKLIQKKEIPFYEIEKWVNENTHFMDKEKNFVVSNTIRNFLIDFDL